MRSGPIARIADYQGAVAPLPMTREVDVRCMRVGVLQARGGHCGGQFAHEGAPMATIRLHRTTTATPQQFVAAITDFGPGRSKIFPNSADSYLKVHSQGPHEADVTEGSKGVWERLRYDWSEPGRVVM